MRGASLIGAYSLPTVNVMLSDLKYLCAAPCHQLDPACRMTSLALWCVPKRRQGASETWRGSVPTLQQSPNAC